MLTPPLPPPSAPVSGSAAARRGRTAMAFAGRLALRCCGLLVALAACTGPAWEGESPKQLRVDVARHEHRVHFETDSAELSDAERRRLLAFMQQAGPDSHRLVRLAGHADERHTEAYNLDLSARRAASVAGALRASGYAAVPIEQTALGEAFPAAAGGDPEAWRRNRRVEVAAERYHVVVPACPDWSRPSNPDFDNRPLSNLGCATATNLGLMVAEPRDLVRGRELDPADGVREAEAVVRYREDKVKDLQRSEGLK